jgi:hypothetical protein
MLRQKFKYGLLDYLQDTVPTTLKVESKQTHIYSINYKGDFPFLEFYFPKSNGSEFPLCERKGLIVDGTCVHEFYEITTKNEKLNLLDKWFCFTVDEIINKKKTNKNIRLFMLKHPFCLILLDNERKVVETPVVAYKRPTSENIKSRPKDAIMGPYYYFNVEERPNYQRVALFLGKIHVPMNFPKDDWDKSQLKKDLLKEMDETNKYIRNTMRITDYDGNWTAENDSVYLGKLDLDDGTSLKESSQWVVKNIKQIVALDE